MSQILTLAKKELRAYFVSPVALIFLGLFLFVVLFAFFWVDTFFRRNLADVRPLFHWLPVMLIFLVAALTMRLWSEEQRMGTLEILMTLPVKVHRLVLGKFLAGLGLVAIALALTLGLPITISSLGDLDWGPVFGGYLAALLLASAYLAIGLCISSISPNQIVSLLLTIVCCGVLYLVGSDTVTAFAGNRGGEVLRAIGTGSRFESIQRGVIDLRDLVYYASLCGGFLFLNVMFLEAKKWSQGHNTRPRRTAFKVAAALVVTNLVVLNVGLAGVRGVRIDMTERGAYSISDVTENLLADLDAPLLIRGYFSAKTHPLLAPLVPKIRDLVEEYSAVGGNKVITEFIDPRDNPAAEKEANEAYGIKSVPFQFADRHEAAVVNSYFQILIKYGDKYETLSFQDLIEVNVSGGINNIEVKLRNLEYDLTRAVKKVVHGFQPLEEVFARAPDKVTLTAYITPKTLPDNFSKVPELIEKVGKEIEGRSGGKFKLEVIDPGGPDKQGLRQQLFRQYGFKPMAASLFSEQIFYLHMLLSMGKKRHQRLLPKPEMSEADLRNEISASLKRMVPGFLKTVGLYVNETPPPRNPMMRQRMPRGPSYRLVRQKISENYEVRKVDLKDGRVPGDIDVLVVVGPQDLDDKQRYAVDQFLMRGGSVVICGGRYAMNAPGMGGLTVKKVDHKLEELLGEWGIKVADKMVLDTQNDSFPIPVERKVMGLTVREIQLLDFPFFIDVRGKGMADGNPVVAGLPSVTLQWSSQLEVKEKKGITYTKLLSSSDKSWTTDSTNVQPDFEKYPKVGFGHDASAETKSRVLAVAAKGTFESFYKDRPSPVFGADDKGASGETVKPEDQAKRRKSRTVEKSPESARLLVVGSSDFLRDEVLALARQTGSDKFMNNLRFIQNVVDWSVADVDLLSIRARGTFARTLEPMDDAARSKWEWVNYGLIVLALGVIVVVTFMRRKNIRPMQLAPAKQKAEG